MPFGVPSLAGATVGVSADPQAQVAMPQQSPIAQAMQSLPTQIQGKPKINWLGVLADALSGAAGRPGLYAQTMLQQRQMGLEEQIYQQHQQAEMQRQMQMYDYQRQHPNDETTQLIIQSGIDPSSPQGRAMYSQALQARINPFTAIDVQQPDGTTQRTYVRPPMAPTAPVGELSDTPPTAAPTPQATGGPTPRASGSFPRPKAKRAK